MNNFGHCFLRGGRMVTQGNKVRLPDDCTIGYIICKYSVNFICIMCYCINMNI